MDIITWINNAVTKDIGFQLSKFSTNKVAWDFLANLCMIIMPKNIKYKDKCELFTKVTILFKILYQIKMWDKLAFVEPTKLQANEAFFK